jgi:hypothetical protein
MDDDHLEPMNDDDDDDDETASHGPVHGRRANGRSSLEMNVSIPQISITADGNSTGEATPSLVNGRDATASESLSSLSEIDTVDSEAETERAEEFDEDGLGSIRVAALPARGPPSEDDQIDESGKLSLSRGRKRRRRDDVEEEEQVQEMMLDEEPGEGEEEEEEEVDVEKRDEQFDEEQLTVQMAEGTEEKPADQDEDAVEPEEPEPEESTCPSTNSLSDNTVDEEKAEANKKRAAALEMLKEIEEEFAKLRDRSLPTRPTARQS